MPLYKRNRKPTLGRIRKSRAVASSASSKKLVMVKGIRQPVQYFKRTLYIPTLATVTAGADYFGSYWFKLDDLPNISEFSTLYDTYFIKGVKFTIMPKADSAILNDGTNTQTLPSFALTRIHSVLDYDDKGVPANLNTLMQYQNLKTTRSTQDHSRYLRPMVAQEVFGSGTGAIPAYAPKRCWLDITRTDVEHYGVKFAITAGQTNQQFAAKITYYIAFKNVR